jgi:hypothetical protein
MGYHRGGQSDRALQEVTCPLCDQVMSPEHIHVAENRSVAIYDAARAEAAKILAQRADLAAATQTLKRRRQAQIEDQSRAADILEKTETRLHVVLAPRLKKDTARLQELIDRRIQLESLQNDIDQAHKLRLMKDEIEQTSADVAETSREWEPLPSSGLRLFCAEVEALLKDWGWKGDPRVEFDQRVYYIVIDGQARQTHGKGVRAVLYSAFVIGLLRFANVMVARILALSSSTRR